MSLLKITTTPIEYEIKTERAKLQTREKDFTEIKCQEAEIARKERLAKYNRDADTVKQVEQSVKSTADYQSVARQRTAGKVKSTSAAALSEESSVRSFISAVSENLTAVSENIDFASQFSQAKENQFSMAQSEQYVEKVNVSGFIKSENQWTVSKKKLEYVPGRFQMKIIQYPKVTIEYIGNEEEK